MEILEPGEEPILNILGQKVALGPHRRDLLSLYQTWINDPEVTRTLLGLRPWTWDEEERWFAGVSNSSDIHFTIYEKATLRPIGTTALHEINHRHRKATFGLMIGAKDCWGQGYGTEVVRLMLDYGFRQLNLHNIMLLVHSFNERGLRAYTRAGFTEMGRRRQAYWLEGRAYDEIYMDCLATSFQPDAPSIVSPD